MSEIEDVPVMSIDGWRDRLEAAIAETGRSYRDISLSAKPKPPSKPQLGPGYLHSILKEGKEPTIGNLHAICEAAGISIYRVLGGFDITPEREEFLRVLARSDQEDVQSLMRLFAARQPRSKTRRPPSG